MKRNVIVTVRGKQSDMENAEPIEVISVGKYLEKDGVRYVSYEEVDEDGNITKNRFKIRYNSMDMIKDGVVKTLMSFEEGKQEFALYETPFGRMEMKIETKELKIYESPQSLSVKLLYGLTVNSTLPIDCELDIEVCEQCN
ncbi:MAG: DUF1934 domain-containing protein [Lachnospiraceae bacterium]|nr:DUF1934 domain-containing protein [Lachnospiraceae bacterium]